MQRYTNEELLEQVNRYIEESVNSVPLPQYIPPVLRPRLDAQIVEKRTMIREYEDEVRARPKPRREYLALMASLRDDLDTLVSQNEVIVRENRILEQEAHTVYQVQCDALRDASRREPEIILAAIRKVRDRLLSESDYTQIPDSPFSEEVREAWRVYRAALRDLPTTVDLENIVFPEPPIIG